MNPLSQKELERLEVRYGKVKQLTFSLANTQYWYVVRKPTFHDYVTFNKNVVNLSQKGQAPKFELDPEIAGTLLKHLIVFPEALDITTIPPGFIIDACIHAINLYDFEDENKIKTLYIQSLKHSHSVVGVIVQRLLSMYGIQGYLAIKDLSENEIMDLLVFTEMINGDLGALSNLLSLNLPMITKGKKSTLNIKEIIGIDNGNQPSSILTQKEQANKQRMETHFKNLGYSPQQIAEMLNRKEKHSLRSDFEPIKSDKVDVHALSEDDLSQVNAKDYAKLKKEGKIASFQESQQSALQQSKSILLQQIEADRAQFGENHQSKNFTGDLKSLLRDIHSQTKLVE